MNDLLTAWMRPMAAALLLAGPAAPRSFCAEPVELGGRLELFADDHLIAELAGDVQQKLLRPEPKEVVFVTDEPWEGNTSGYYTCFKEGGLYRMIYRGWQHDAQKKSGSSLWQKVLNTFYFRCKREIVSFDNFFIRALA